MDSRTLSLESCVEVLRTVVPQRCIAYASVPLTTGPRLLSVARSGALRSAKLGTKVLREAVLAPNKKDAAAFAKGLRSSLKCAVVDPSRLPNVAGWSQQQYVALWYAVILEYCSRVVFADGWQYSNGCVLEFLAASFSGIQTFDSNGDEVSRGNAISLIGVAISEMQEAGLPTSIIETSRDRLVFVDPSDEFEAIKRITILTAGEARRIALSLVGCLMNGKDGTLISSPDGATIDTQTLDSLRATSLQYPIGTVALQRSLFRPPQWSRLDVDRLWRDVIRRYTASVVMYGAWERSAQCALDLCSALEAGVPVFEEKGRRLSAQVAVNRITEALSSLRVADRNMAAVRSLEKAMAKLKHVA